jgi:hypothetical protein
MLLSFAAWKLADAGSFCSITLTHRGTNEAGRRSVSNYKDGVMKGREVEWIVGQSWAGKREKEEEK